MEILEEGGVDDPGWGNQEEEGEHLEAMGVVGVVGGMDVAVGSEVDSRNQAIGMEVVSDAPVHAAEDDAGLEALRPHVTVAAAVLVDSFGPASDALKMRQRLQRQRLQRQEKDRFLRPKELRVMTTHKHLSRAAKPFGSQRRDSQTRMVASYR